MNVRTRRQNVTFPAPFALPGLDRLQPAGTYVVETDEELIEPLSFTAYRRLSTMIVVPLGPGSYQMIKIDPVLLEGAEVAPSPAG